MQRRIDTANKIQNKIQKEKLFVKENRGLNLINIDHETQYSCKKSFIVYLVGNEGCDIL